MSETGKVYQVKNVAGLKNVKGKVYQVTVVGSENGEDDSLVKVTSVNGQTGAVTLGADNIPVAIINPDTGEETETDVAEALNTLKTDHDDLGDQLSELESKIPDNASLSNPVATKEDIGRVIIDNSASASIELGHNTIYDFSAPAVTSLTVSLPAVMEIDYVSQINFSSGATATAFTTVDAIKWAGDDIADNAFVPAANKRYVVMLFYDGLNIRAISQGVA